MSIATKAAKATSQGGMVGRVNYGDPGLFGAIGGALKTVAKGALGFATGGPAGAVAAVLPQPRTTVPQMIPTQMPAAPRPGLVGAAQRVLPFGESGYVSGVPPKGYRLNKSGYFLRDGTYVPPQSRYVKSRRRNPLNPRALSRAMTRLTSAKRAAKALGRISIRAK